MLITDDFVLLNFPKTGSSFTREALKRVYGQSDSTTTKLLEYIGVKKPKLREVFLPKIDESYHSELHDQHGTWRQIPRQFQGRQVVSITREPISRYLSAYRFGWWKQYPPGDKGEILKHYPDFPNLSFRQYYEMSNHFSLKNRLKEITPKIPIGVHTVQFIQFYFRKPEAVLRKIDNQYIDQKEYLNDMAEIRFLEQTQLRTDLKKYLTEIGKSAAELHFLDAMKEVNSTKINGSERIEKRTDDIDIRTAEDILSKDRLLYEIFPHYRPT